MGDIADYDIEQGMDMWVAHTAGHCFQDCRYCDEEDEEEWYTETKDDK